MFLHVSAIVFMGGSSPLDKDPPGQRPLGKDPLGRDPEVVTPSGSHQGGQYASYWNAYLLLMAIDLK